MKDIKCPKDLQFENTFQGSDCKREKFYNGCYHCWGSAIAKFKHDIHNEAIQEFAEKLLKQEVVDKSVIKRLAEQLTNIPD